MGCTKTHLKPTITHNSLGTFLTVHFYNIYELRRKIFKQTRMRQLPRLNELILNSIEKNDRKFFPQSVRYIYVRNSKFTFLGFVHNSYGFYCLWFFSLIRNFVSVLRCLINSTKQTIRVIGKFVYFVLRCTRL